MESHLSEESLWASGLAARLRTLQASFADDDPATRRDFIVQEIERALKGFVPEQRQARLQALSAWFPVWQGTRPAAPAQLPMEAPAEAPEDLLEKLLAALPNLSAAQREQFIARLQEAGLASEPATSSIAVAPEILKRLGLPDTTTFDAARVATAFALLLDMALALDQFVWKIWKEVAPRSLVRQEADLGKLSGQYLAASTDVSAAQVRSTVEKTRKLLASCVGATRPAAAAFARERSRLLNPMEIEALARPEASAFKSIESVCWRKYKDQLYKEYGGEQMMERAIQDALVRQVETLFRGGPM
jgi:hypothetical protein